MDKATFYRYATWGLLALNIILLLLHILPLMGPPRGPDNGMQRAMERLELDDEQHELFATSALAHHNKIQQINEAQRDVLQQYFSSLTMSSDTVGSLPPAYASLCAEKVSVTYQHFIDVKKILKPAQLPRYEHWVDTAIKRILVNKSRIPQRGAPKGPSDGRPPER